PTDHSRAKYGGPFLCAHHFWPYSRTKLNHFTPSRERYVLHLSPEATRYVEFDYLCHNVRSSPLPPVKAARSVGLLSACTSPLSVQPIHELPSQRTRKPILNRGHST